MCSRRRGFSCTKSSPDSTLNPKPLGLLKTPRSPTVSSTTPATRVWAVAGCIAGCLFFFSGRFVSGRGWVAGVVGGGGWVGWVGPRGWV